MDEANLITLRDVERMLGVTRWTLYDFVHTGKLPAVKLPGGHYRVRRQDVESLARTSGLGSGGNGQQKPEV
jgi:excisionase family DNA binding protein